MSIKGGRAFLLLLLCLRAEPKEMTWRYDADISNPANWIDEKLAQGCNGVHFSPHNDAPVYIHDLVTQELVLPSDGEIVVLETGSIQFKDTHKCIRLKPINYHDWNDEDSWEKSDQNAAEPHNERIPCDHDDVIFPKGYHTRLRETLGASIEVRSMRFGDGFIDNRDARNLMRTPLGKDVFYNPIDSFAFDITEQPCKDPYGCFCHRDYVPCPSKTYPKAPCLSPIEPEEFCYQICGAAITFKPKTGFQIENLQEQLKKYTVDTHASRVKDYLGNDVVQVVFSEKEYSGKSTDEAENFLNELQSSDKDVIEGAQMLKSGHFYIEGSHGSTMGIVFGTLAMVGVFFGVLLYLNGDTRVDLIISRLNRGRRSLFTTPFFARFDTTDENLVIDGQSTAGSVLDIARAFDNPMFGKTAPTTSAETHATDDAPIEEDEENDVEE